MRLRTPSVADASRVFGPGSRRFSALAAAVALAAVCLSGCGGSGHGSSSASTARSATSTVASVPAPKVSEKVRKEEQAIHQQVLASLHTTSKARYGGVPADLRNRQKPPPNQVLQSSLSRPSDGIQGVDVRLHYHGATAMAVGVGPDIPTRVQGTFNLHTPATWEITFSDVHGTFPLSPAMFTLTDEQGQLLKPHVTTITGGPLPARVPAGSPFTVRLKSDLISEGDGKLRYAPDAGGKLLVEWDFDVETD